MLYKEWIHKNIEKVLPTNLGTHMEDRISLFRG